MTNSFEDYISIGTGGVHRDGLVGAFLKVYNETPELVRNKLIEMCKASSWTEAALRLTQSASSASTECMFRKSPTSDELIASLWLGVVAESARGRISATNIEANKRKPTISDLREVARMSVDTGPVELLARVEEKFGVIVVVCRAPSGSKVDGVSFNLFGKIRAIGLSLRYSRYDYFLFTLLHELAHHCLHINGDSEPILDDLDANSQEEIEIQANRLALDSIVPRALMERAKVLRTKSESDLLDLALAANVSPAAVAGIVRKKLGDYRLFSKIVNDLDVRKVFGVNE